MRMQQLLKQAQEMQKKYEQELEDTTAEASVGDGLVTVKMNGHKHLLSVKIAPKAFDSGNTALLEGLFAAAVNEVSGKMDEILPERVGKLATSMPRIF